MLDLIRPDWPVNTKVQAFSTTRTGGVSQAPFESLNLGHHVGDKEGRVLKNRQRLPLADSTIWLSQVHGSDCVELNTDSRQYPQADSAFTQQPGLVCGVMTADCAPILLCNQSATCVAAIHAGWRGLAAGVIQNCLRQMPVPAEQLFAWIGPCISAERFEVGREIKDAFDAHVGCFVESGINGKYLADIKLLCSNILKQNAVKQVFIDPSCTYLEPQRFFSHRYSTHHGKAVTGRMFSGIYLTS